MSSTETEPHTPAQVTRRLYELTSKGELETLDTILAPDVVDHGVGAEDLTGPAQIKAALGAFREAFPDMQITLDDLIECGDKVAVRWTVRGTHQGTFQGIPATGRTVRMTGTDLLRIANGKVAERWGNSDELGLLQQLVDRRQGERRAPRATDADRDRRRGADRRRS